MKLDKLLGNFTKICQHIKIFYKDWTTITDTLHKDLHAFLRGKVTVWGIPIRGIPRGVFLKNSQRPHKSKWVRF
jgi:hypothetical protein